MVDYPFDRTGIERGADGIQRYRNLPASVVAMLRSSVGRAPDAEAVVELDGQRLTYAQLWDRSARVAGGLREQGVRVGDRVGIRMPNGADWAVAFFGTLMAGAVAVPVNIRLTESEVDYIVQDSGASCVLTAGSPLPDGRPVAEEGLHHEDLAAIFYTSGTTGFPKGAMTSHANFLTNCENVRRVSGTPEHDPTARNLISVPLFHVTACNSQLLPSVHRGGTAVIMPRFDVHRFLRAMAEEDITVVTAVPAVFWLALSQRDVADHDLSKVQHVSYGGAPTPPDLVARIKKSFPGALAGNGYGLTETSAMSTFLPDAYAGTHADSIGFPAPVVDLDILEPDPATGVGELRIRGGHVVMGYWNKPEATAETFRDGWLHTGDLARIDEGGFTYLVDRAKDMINRGGENVYCVEVENALASAPGVHELAIIGVPDPMMGEKVGAVVVPRPGGNFDGEALLTYARTCLADFKIPQYLAIRTDPLPRNAGGKILKSRLREDTVWSQQLR